jgi:hypothetical protein
MRSLTATAAALLAVSVLAACGEQGATTGAPSESGYDGPLHVARSDATHPRAGAAGNVVECEAFGSGGSSGVEEYAEGATADSAEQALRVASSEGGFGGVQEGLLVAKEEDDRVLYVVEVGDRVKQAVIVRNGPATEGAGGPGWYVESWAHCDYSELPRSFTDSIGLQVWTGADGHPVPTTRIESWIGPEHCDWQSMTFLHLGKAEYVRNPQPDLADFFAEPYREHAELPGDAVDTGWERDGDHLWLSPDKRRAYVGKQQDVEVWPRTTEHLGCA